MRYRLTLEATIEGTTNRDALRRMGEHLVARAAEDELPDELSGDWQMELNYYLHVVPAPGT